MRLLLDMCQLLFGRRLLLLHLQARLSPFEIVNFSNSRTVSLARLIEVIEQAIGKVPLIERLQTQPGDVPRTFADTSKAARLVGYAPIPIELGVERFAKWLQSEQVAIATGITVVAIGDLIGWSEERPNHLG